MANNIRFQINLYPNPAKEILTIQTNFNKVKVLITDLNGRTILKPQFC